MGIFDNEFSGKGIIPTETFGKTSGSIGGVSSIYGSINEVVAAYCQDKITGRQATNELMNFFGQSENEANDIIKKLLTLFQHPNPIQIGKVMKVHLRQLKNL